MFSFAVNISMDLVLLVNLVESCRYLPPYPCCTFTETNRHSPWQAFDNSDKSSLCTIRTWAWFYADMQGFTSVPCLICLSCCCWFCSFSYSFPFLTENQIHASNNPMEHGLKGTNCHQEWPGLFSIRKETLLVDNEARLRW